MAAIAVDAIGPLPDANVAADALDTLSTHVRRCNNLPAIAGPQAILAAILQLGMQINNMETNLSQRMDSLESRIIARYANSTTSLHAPANES